MQSPHTLLVNVCFRVVMGKSPNAKLPHKNMDLNGSVFFCKNPTFMSICVVVMPLGITTTQTDIKYLMEKYGTIQVHFYEVVLLYRYYM